jgi:hypothetical protein
MVRAQINKHGLKRRPEADIMRIVRERAGFGCVVCGNALCDYDHIEPEWVEAREHNPNGIVFLCHQCHMKRTRGHLSKSTVMYHAKNPKAKEKGFCFEAFDFHGDCPTFVAGSSTFKMCTNLISLDGKPILSFLPPETERGPYRLNADFKDKWGNNLLQVTDNAWEANASVWDILVEGKRIKFRDKPRSIVLEIKTEPPNVFHILRMDMFIYCFRIISDKNGIIAVSPDGSLMSIGGISGSNLNTVIALHSR